MEACQAFGACCTEDSDYVSCDGTRTIGRAQHQDNHDRLFRGVLSGSALVGELESIRHIAPGVAIVHGSASVLTPWRSQLPKRRLSRQTMPRSAPTRAGAARRSTTAGYGRSPCQRPTRCPPACPG
ncbi:hypothetical protein ABZ746_09540 [Streptomyces sp. NPDC020096]